MEGIQLQAILGEEEGDGREENGTGLMWCSLIVNDTKDGLQAYSSLDLREDFWHQQSWTVSDS